MELSDRFIDAMLRPFNFGLPVYPGETLENHLTLDRGNVFNKSLVINTLGDDIEVSVIVRRQVENIINANLNGYKIEKVLLPLYTNGNDQSRITFNSIMREFFCRVPFNQRLLKVTTNKGETYYGGCGLVLDEGYNPLLMCGLKARKVITEGDGGAEVVSMQYYRAICHVSPIVFAEPTKLINKGIIKKLIPLYTTMDISFPTTGISSIPDSRKVEVIIDDFSKFFISPIAPTPSKYSNDALNKCLNDNIEDILYLI